MGPRDTIQSYNTSFFFKGEEEEIVLFFFISYENSIIADIIIVDLRFPVWTRTTTATNTRAFFHFFQKDANEGEKSPRILLTHALRSSGETETFPFSVNVFCKRVTGPANVLAR